MIITHMQLLILKYSRTSLFRSPMRNGKKFEIAGFRNNRGSVKGKGKSKGIRRIFLRNSGDFELIKFEIAGFDCNSKPMARQGRIPDFLTEGVVSIDENSSRAKGMGEGKGGGGGGAKGQMKLRHYINATPLRFS